MKKPSSSLSPKARVGRDAILRMLREQKMKAGDKIPSERQLAATLGMNHRTVRRALEELVEDGVVEKRPRLGNFVNDVERYTPLAVAFRTYLLNDTTNQPTAGLTLEGINDTLDPARYSLTMLSYRVEYFIEDVVRFVQARKIRGLFLFGATQIRSEDVRMLTEMGVKVVLLTNHPHLASLGISSFYHTSVMALPSLMTGLIGRGHRRIALVRYAYPKYSEWDPIVQSIHEQYALGPAEDVTVTLDNAEAGFDFSPLNEIFSPERKFTAAIVPDEVVARKVFQEAYRRRLFIPDALSLCACSDNTPEAHPVPLTAPETSIWRRRVVVAAAEHLMALFDGTAQEGIHMPIGGGVVWRESVAPVC